VTRPTLIAALAAPLLLAAAPLGAQDEPVTPIERIERSDDAREREILARRIEAQLDRLAAQEERLTRALEMLDEGAPTADVRRSILSEWRDERERGGPGPRRGDRGRDRAEPDGDRALRFIERHRPETAERLRELRERDPERFREELAGMMPRLRSLMERAERRPERWEAEQRFHDLERRARRLADEVVAGDPGRAPAATLELRRAVADGFEIRLGLTRAETDELRRRVEGLTEQLETLETGRESIIDEHVRRLVDAAHQRAAGDADAPAE
jgi:flagellar motility protein MotE (MotC chaperone)